MPGFDLAAQRPAEGLLAIADTQDRHIGCTHRRIDRRGILVQRRSGATREHDARRLHGGNGHRGALERMAFAIDAGPATAAGGKWGVVISSIRASGW